MFGDPGEHTLSSESCHMNSSQSGSGIRSAFGTSLLGKHVSRTLRKPELYHSHRCDRQPRRSVRAHPPMMPLREPSLVTSLAWRRPYSLTLTFFRTTEAGRFLFSRKRRSLSLSLYPQATATGATRAGEVSYSLPPQREVGRAALTTEPTTTQAGRSLPSTFS